MAVGNVSSSSTPVRNTAQAVSAQTTSSSEASSTVSSSADGFERSSGPNKFQQFANAAPRTLGHPVAATEGKGLNNSENPLRSSSGRISAEAWNEPRQILGRLTQSGATGAPHQETNGQRCGGANILAPAIMNGPDATATTLRNVASNPSNLTAAQRQQLRDISSRVDNRTASFEDLSTAQHLMFRAGNTRTTMNNALSEVQDSRLTQAERTELRRLSNNNVRINADGTANQDDLDEYSRLLTKGTGRPSRVVVANDPQRPNDMSARFLQVEISGSRINSDRGGLGDEEIANLADRTGNRVNRQVTLDPVAFNADNSSATMENLLGQLQPGEAATMRLSADGRDSNASHFVTVGRNPEGVPYVYNSDPSQGDYTLYTGNGNDLSQQPADFTRQLREYSSRVFTDVDGDLPNVIVTRPRGD